MQHLPPFHILSSLNRYFHYFQPLRTMPSLDNSTVIIAISALRLCRHPPVFPWTRQHILSPVSDGVLCCRIHPTLHIIIQPINTYLSTFHQNPSTTRISHPHTHHVLPPFHSRTGPVDRSRHREQQQSRSTCSSRRASSIGRCLTTQSAARRPCTTCSEQQQISIIQPSDCYSPCRLQQPKAKPKRMHRLMPCSLWWDQQRAPARHPYCWPICSRP